jgi:hypothetical protein
LKPAPAGSLLEYLQQIPDPRGRQGQRHVFVAMLATVVCAYLQNARSLTAIVEWLDAQEVALRHALGYRRKPPRLGAFRKLLMKLPAEHLEAAIRNWLRDCLGDPDPDGPLQPVALDGKTLRGTLKGHERALQLLSLFDHATGCTLSQARVPENTNEAKAALELLQTIVLKGRIVTGDAMFCQRDVCAEILRHGGHYLFVVKDNQPNLENAVAAEFRAAFSPGGRTATRRAS